MAVIPNLGPPDVLGLQLPEAFTNTSAGQDFWELKSKNIWRPKVEATALWNREMTQAVDTIVPKHPLSTIL